jgi:DNA polymerase
MSEQAQIQEFLSDLGISGLPESWFVSAAQKSNLESSLDDFRETLSYEELREITKSCPMRQLSDSLTGIVLGEGTTDSPQFAFVSVGPTVDVDTNDSLLMGKAGQLLKDAISKGLGLNWETDVYILNLVKCRPPENRTPYADEVQSCTAYLHRQLELVKPKVIIGLGQTPQLALSAKDVGFTKLRGQWQKWNGIPLMPTFHPAQILKNPETKKLFWEDLKEVMKFLGL